MIKLSFCVPFIVALCCSTAIAQTPAATAPTGPIQQNRLTESYAGGHIGMVAEPTPAMRQEWPMGQAFIAWIAAFNSGVAHTWPSLAADVDFDSLPAEQIVEKCGLQSAWFGNVQALAPKTITVLRTNADMPNIPNGFVGEIGLQEFVGSLSGEQLRQLGAQGLGMEDLDETQQAILRTILPSPFEIVPSGAQAFHWTAASMGAVGAEREAIEKKALAQTQAYLDQVETVPEADLHRLRLRGCLGDHVLIDGRSIFIPAACKLAAGAYKLNNTASAAMAGQGKELFTPVVPNRPKPVDLIWESKPLRALVDVREATDCGVLELVKCCAVSTGLELHVDPRLASRRILLLGDTGKPQPAGDLLQALDLCLGAAWRKVGDEQAGPAYLLTDDVSGLAVRRQTIKGTLHRWSHGLATSLRLSNQLLFDGRWEQLFTFAAGDPEALPPDQIRHVRDSRDTEYYVTLNWSDLPQSFRTTLQNAAHIRRDESQGQDTPESWIIDRVKPGTRVTVHLDLQLDLELPRTGAMSWQSYSPQIPPPTVAASAASTPVQTFTEPLRGLLCPVSSTDELRGVLDRMPALNMNALFLDVFYNGRTSFENDAIPPATADNAKILTTAIVEGAKRHIAVYAVVDALCWQKDAGRARAMTLPDGVAQDVTMTGEPPADVIRQGLARGELQTYGPSDLLEAREGNQGWVSPMDTHVRQTLSHLIATLAQTPGLHGIVFQDISPPGYGPGTSWLEEGYGIGLGYSPANRLKFIRDHGTDPIDLAYSEQAMFDESESNLHTSFDVGLPDFPSSQPCIDDWVHLKSTAEREAVELCFVAAHQANPSLPIYISARNAIRPWSYPDQPVTVDSDSAPAGGLLVDKTVFLVEDVSPSQRRNNDALLSDLFFTRKVEGNMRQGGIVVNLSIGAAEEDLIKTLDHIAPCFAVPDAMHKADIPAGHMAGVP